MKAGHTVKQIVLFLGFLQLIFSEAKGQFYTSGQDPAGIKWMQLKGNHFRLMYPIAFSVEAKRFAVLLDTCIEPVSRTMPSATRKFPVVIHPYSIESNGFVIWAPWRMEIFPLPPQDIDAEDWLTQLAIHEYRHIVQLQKLNQGFTRGLGILAGEQGPGVVSGLIPRWFLEGDAVNTETTLGIGKRGQLPSFHMELRTLLLSQPEPYPFLKAMLGSYRNFVPDYYQYGYVMVSWTEEKYPAGVFPKAIDFTARRPYLLYPFGISLKKTTGLNQPGLYKKAMQDLRDKWNRQMPMQAFPDKYIWNKRKNKDYVTYRFPVFFNDSTVIACKSGLGEVPSFIKIGKGGKEKKILHYGAENMVRISVANNQLVWTEIKSDIRWQNRSYSVIKRLDLSTGKQYRVAKKSRYFAPVLSVDAVQIAVVRITPENAVSLVILQTKDGKILKEIPSPGNAMLMEPCWLGNSNIGVLLQEQEGKSIWKYDLESNTWCRILPATTEELGNLSGFWPWLLFRGGFTGISNIFALNCLDSSVWQVTSVRYGAVSPSVSADGKRIVYSDYTANGYDIAEIPFDTALWKRWNSQSLIPNAPLAVGQYPVSQKQAFSGSNAGSFTETPYRQWLHLFSIHSWLPFYADYDLLQQGDPALGLGFILLGQDLLNTSYLSFGNDWSKGYPIWKGTWTYAGLYPVIRIQAERGGQPLVYRAGANALPALEKDHFRISTRMSFPLNHTNGAWLQSMHPSVEWEYKNDWFYKPDQATFIRGIHYFNVNLYGYRYFRLAPRDISPRFGQIAELNLNFSPFSSDEIGPLLYGKFGIFLPGIGKHHSTFVNYWFLNQFYTKSRYLYSSGGFFPRGYIPAVSAEMHKWSIDYRFPLWYPDWHIQTLFYLKRIRADMFSDYATGNILSDNRQAFNKKEFFSCGATLYTDFHLFRIIFPFSLGLRILYIPEFNTFQFAHLINIDLTDF
ncbi:MAG: TolB family protein [Bacteroidales bacterium]